MMMRPQKTQLPAEIKKTDPGFGYFVPDYHLLAGYIAFELTLIGAAGGRGGTATGSNSTDNIINGGGGGGGGLLRVLGNIKDIAGGSCFWTVGAMGAVGADKGNRTKAEDGDVGGSSVFNPSVLSDLWSAYGGDGGVGGRVDQISGGVGYDPSKGGNGGKNSENLGSGGVRGNNGPYPPPSEPTKGNAIASTVFFGGFGGGGGTGRAKINGTNQNTAQAGAEGNDSAGDPFTAAGGPVSSSKGGYGGGANLKGATGESDEFYGCGYTGENVSGDGALFLRFT